MKVTARLILLGCLTASSLFLSGLRPLALAQETSSVHVDADDPADTRYEQLEPELKSFLDARSGSEEELILQRIEGGKPAVEDLQVALKRAYRSGKAADLKPGISHNHAFEVGGLQLSASLYVPESLNRPSALWVIPAHPSQTVNSDKHFEFTLAGLPQDALVLWVHLYDAITANPDTPLGKKYGSGVRNDRQRVIDHGDVYAAAVAMALRQFPVDPDRVYCWGVSASGIATWWNGVCLPDVFAGICPCDTRPIQVIPWMGSLLQMRVGILHGEKDDRCPVELLRRVDKDLQRLGVERKFVEVAGGRHGQTWRRHGPELCAWVCLGCRAHSQSSTTKGDVLPGPKRRPLFLAGSFGAGHRGARGTAGMGATSCEGVG